MSLERESNPHSNPYQGFVLPLNYPGWGDRRDLNPQQSAPQADALPG